MPSVLRSTSARRVAAAVVLALIAAWFVPTTTRAHASGTKGLYLSLRADRSGAVMLGGQTVSGKIYVYWSKSASPTDTYGTSRVNFSVDGAAVRSEVVKPYDMGSTAADGTVTV